MAKRKKIDERIPRTKVLIEPTFKALKELGGSGSNKDILEKIIDDLHIPDDVTEILKHGSTTKTELENQADWARTYMNKCNVIEKIGTGLWAINTNFSKVEEIDGSKIISEYRNKKNKNILDKTAIADEDKVEDDDPTNDEVEFPDEEKPWRSKLSDILKNMDPYGFERLAQRLLRECGFSDVKITQRSGDGGIDGTGKLKINGIFSFNVAFQCKRYSNPVGAPYIRDFRGSLSTNIEKGVFITTSRFTRDAEREASSPGKKQIDLIDGEDFIDKLAQYEIGLKAITVYEIDENFFEDI